MAGKIQTLRGTHDILPEDVHRWQLVERVIREVCALYGFREIRTPVFEQTSLFARSVGETSDIVRKEMYTLAAGEESVTLRPECTASVVRAFVQHAMHRDIAAGYPVKLFYVGPMFRRERPQAGRQRQFHQFGVEVLGAAEPAADIETLVLLDRFLERLGITGRQLVLNSLGDPAERHAYRDRLREWLAPRLDAGDDDQQRMLRDNPLRILDTKDAALKGRIADAPTILDFLGDDSRAHFEAVQQGLTDRGLAFRIEPRLVRGLDYYVRTVFEVTSERLGAQDAILGGGRYDGLVEALGGPAVPGFGFALGIERLLMLLPDGTADAAFDVAVVALGEAGQRGAIATAERLRDANLRVLLPLTDRPMGAQLKRAGKLGARFALFVGADEVAAERYGFKDLASGEQQDLTIEDAIARAVRAETPANAR